MFFGYVHSSMRLDIYGSGFVGQVSYENSFHQNTCYHGDFGTHDDTHTTGCAVIDHTGCARTKTNRACATASTIQRSGFV
jgi:hypothetical protein